VILNKNRARPTEREILIGKKRLAQNANFCFECNYSKRVAFWYKFYLLMVSWLQKVFCRDNGIIVENLANCKPKPVVRRHFQAVPFALANVLTCTFCMEFF